VLIVTQSLVPPAAAAVGILASRSLAVSSLIYHPLDPHTQQTTPCRLSIAKLVVLPATATLSRGENLWSSRLTYSVDSQILSSSLADLAPTFGDTVGVLSPFTSVFCHSD